VIRCDESHPRPQLQRETWHDLTGTWGFAVDDDDIGVTSGWPMDQTPFDRSILVPFPPESEMSGINDKCHHRAIWYRRAFRLPDSAPSNRWLLHFGAVDYRASVWVNGQLIATHEGGNTSFHSDITSVLRPSTDDQIVVVRAEDDAYDMTQPRGKQYWEDEPAEIWYWRTSGIWQTVWLESVPETYIAGVRWTPDPDAGTLGLELTLGHTPFRPLVARVRLSLHGRQLVDDRYLIDRQVLDRRITLDVAAIGNARRRILWSPEHPNLIDAEITLEDGGNIIDEVYSYAGLRSAGWGNGHFLLNGTPYYLRMLLNQGYWPESHLTAPSLDALRHDVEMAKALGYNGVRNHQKVEDPRFLYWCDKLGLLVWGEMANAYNFSVSAVERFTREWLDVVRRDYNHPSVVSWVPFNESWGVANIASDPIQRHYVSSIYHLTHALDTTRPVVANDGWEHFIGDIWGVHDYALIGDQIRERYGSSEAVAKSIREHRAYYRPIALSDVEHQGQPIMLTEVGGIDYVAGAIELLGPRAAGSEEEFYAHYAEVIDAILDCPTVVGFCYTQLADTEQEKSGLLTEDRGPKFNLERIREITQRPARAMPVQFTFGLPRPIENRK